MGGGRERDAEVKDGWRGGRRTARSGRERRAGLGWAEMQQPPAPAPGTTVTTSALLLPGPSRE